MTQLETAILSAAIRREVSADIEAKLHGIAVEQANKAIRALARRGLLWQTSKAKKSYWGTTYAGYRASTDEDENEQAGKEAFSGMMLK